MSTILDALWGQGTPVLLDAALKGVMLLTLAAAATLLMRRASAAARRRSATSSTPARWWSTTCWARSPSAPARSSSGTRRT